MTLQELTGQESGLIVFQNKNLIIANWSSFEGIPRMFAGSLISLEASIPEVLMQESWNETEIMEYLQDKALIYSDLKQEADITKSKVYHLDKAITIIAPEGWG